MRLMYAKKCMSPAAPSGIKAIILMRRIYNWSGDKELIFTSDNNSQTAMSGNTINKALRTMVYDTKSEVCGYGFRTVACSALIESAL